jgi:hypothetical protein
MGCGWCGTFIVAPYCADDGTIDVYYCNACRHFSFIDQITKKIWRIRNGSETDGPDPAAYHGGSNAVIS